MAEGTTIRKGFFFYFGLFLLLLVAVFLVCVVIMVFNPGKTILWMKYFSNNAKGTITKTTDNETVIDWSSLNSITVNCGYADVFVESDYADLKESGIFIVNTAKGFAGAQANAKFDYSVVLNGADLTVDVTEPEGFLYFSKNITITLHLNSVSDRNFDNIDLIVKTTSGNVNLGGTFGKADTMPKTKISSVNVETNSGDIRMTNFFSPRSVTGDFNLTTNSGKISSACVVDDSTGLDLSNAKSVSLTTTSGDIKLNVLKTTGNQSSITCKKGTVSLNKVDVDTLNFANCVRGNYILHDVVGDITFGGSVDSLSTPIINIENLQGKFSLSGNASASNPNVTIGKITDALFVQSSKGKVVVSEAAGAVNIISDGNLVSNIGIVDRNDNSIAIKSKKGAVTLKYLGSVSVSGTEIETDSGKVKINVTGDAKFHANLFVNNVDSINTPDNDRLAENKISLNIGNTVEKKNDFSMGDETRIVNVFTNANVSVTLV